MSSAFRRLNPKKAEHPARNRKDATKRAFAARNVIASPSTGKNFASTGVLTFHPCSSHDVDSPKKHQTKPRKHALQISPDSVRRARTSLPFSFSSIGTPSTMTLR